MASAARIPLKTLLTGVGLMVVSTFLTGVDFPLVKIVVPKGLNGNEVTTVCMLGGALLYWVASWVRRRSQPLKRQDIRKIVVGGLSLWVFMEMFNLAIAFGNPVDVSVASTLTPVFVALIAFLWRGVRVSRLEVIGLGVGFAAVVLLVVSGGGSHAGRDNFLGILFAIASCVGYAVYLIVMAKPLATYHPMVLQRWVFLVASVPALIFVPQMVQAPLFHHAHLAPQWWSMIAIVVGPIFCSFLLINRSITLIGSELTGLFDYFIPVAALVCSLVLGVVHGVRWDQVVAMIIVVGGMVITTIGKRRNPTPQSQA